MQRSTVRPLQPLGQHFEASVAGDVDVGVGGDANERTNHGVVPTRGYIQALAEQRSGVFELFPEPLLQVIERETKFRDPGFSEGSFKNGKDKNVQVPM